MENKVYLYSRVSTDSQTLEQQEVDKDNFDYEKVDE